VSPRPDDNLPKTSEPEAKEVAPAPKKRDRSAFYPDPPKAGAAAPTDKNAKLQAPIATAGGSEADTPRDNLPVRQAGGQSADLTAGPAPAYTPPVPSTGGTQPTGGLRPGGPETRLSPVPVQPEPTKAVGGTPPLQNTSAPSPRPAPRPGARPVISYDEALYVCQTGDNWLSISKRFYETEAYASALQLFNHQHPQASPTMKADGALTIGDQVFVPSASILHERYAGHIRSPRPAGRP
jgi:hypothetical protein